MKEANLGNLLIQHLMNSPFGIRAVHRAVLDGRVTGHHMRLKFSSFFVAQMWRPGSLIPLPGGIGETVLVNLKDGMRL